MEEEEGQKLGSRSAEEAYSRATVLIEAKPSSSEEWMAVKQLLQQAADEGHGKAIGRLGRWYLLGIGGCAKNEAKAYGMLRESAIEFEDDEAQYWLARMLLQGPSESQDTGIDSNKAEEDESDEFITYDDTGARRKSGKQAAKEVLLEIRAQRKAALKAKVSTRLCCCVLLCVPVCCCVLLWVC